MTYNPTSRKQRVSDPQKKKAIDNLNANRKKADIDALANQGNEVETRVTAVEGEVDVLQTEMVQAQADINQLEVDVTQAQSDISQLQIDVAGKEDAIAPGTTAQYWRGDKTWQALPTSLPPSGSAGGDLSGTYPNPSVVDDSHSHSYSTLSGVTPSTRTITINGVTYDLSANRTWTVSATPTLDYTNQFLLMGA